MPSCQHFCSGLLGRLGIPLVVLVMGASTSVAGCIVQRPTPVPRTSAPAPVVIRNVTLIDGRGAPSLSHATVVIANGRIAAIGSTTSVEIPRGARVVDGAGRFLIPGMWDMHTHVTIEGSTSLGMYLASGVTSVRQVRLESADTTVTPPNRVIVPDSASAQGLVDSIAALGVDFIKIRTYENPTTYWAIARAVRRRGLKLFGHPPWGMNEIAVVDSGQKSVEHGYFPWKLDSMPEARREQVLDAFRRGHVAQVPTLITWHPRRFAPDSIRAAVDGPIARRHQWRSAVSPSLLNVWRTEVERFAATEAVRSATQIPAQFLGLDDSLGTIEPGKIADLVLLDADPTIDIRNARRIRAVVQGGSYYDRTALDQLVEARPPAGQR